MVFFEDEQQFIKGFSGGLIAGIVMFVFVEFFRWIGLTKFGVSYLAGDTVFTFKNNFGMNLVGIG
jgi:hypothetical protein